MNLCKKNELLVFFFRSPPSALCFRAAFLFLCCCVFQLIVLLCNFNISLHFALISVSCGGQLPLNPAACSRMADRQR